MSIIKAPFTTEQVKGLNKYQECPYIHPFTCGHSVCGAVLCANQDGWQCPKCDYRQDWAHDFMADGSLTANMTELYEQIKAHKKQGIKKNAKISE